VLSSTVSKFIRSAYLLCEPIGLVWLALLLLTFLLWRKRQRGFAAATAGLALFVFAIGGTDLSGVLLRSLERPYVGMKPADLPAGDAVVVLGGGFEPSLHEVANLHLTPAGDRIVMGLELIRLGKAPVLCIGGSSAFLSGEHFVESEVVRRALIERQVTSAEIIALGYCLNTWDEAVQVRELATAHGWRRVLLVTSANHMRRAAATFATAGVPVVPVPCNFQALNGNPSRPWRLTPPGYGGFVRFSTWMHEILGWWAYRAKGWVGTGAAGGD
jgi:uncharacterized SAM-binding protein YcdF (DUF218 family)